MTRAALALIALLSIALVGLSCNRIVGIDGPDGVECIEASACDDLGACVHASCEDGACKHAPFPAGVSCGAGVCDAKGRCVECLKDADCAGDPVRPRCADSGRCVECLQNGDCVNNLSLPFCSPDLACIECLSPTDCKDPVRPTCSRGACIQCASDAECTLPTKACLEARCIEGVCLFVASPSTTACDGGTCDGEGDCAAPP